ncbi:TipJ family phage tail tip protein [Azospirillum doebereinerae]|uniref:Host specificity protein J n=1 Tax=Azospirillum doebereinerae TaxID=92933 RepID=A0A3S0WIX9_9PROT|nr:phage tail protein [Azospirillum doebereinerae]RUQ65103.1 host specificity protein J [Azospirillum doebereinerae]
MLRTVHLHGSLGRSFGRSFTLNADSVVEVVRLLEANFPGRFGKAIEAGAFKLVRGDRAKGLALGESMLTFKLGAADLHITPVAAGAGGKGKGGVKAVIGVAIMAIAIIAAPVTGGTSLGGLVAVSASGTVTGLTAYGSIAMMGLSMALSGISQIIAPQPGVSGSLESADKQQSFLFNGAVNSVEQGGPVPLIYGRMRVGSVVGSAGLTVEQVLPPPTDNSASNASGPIVGLIAPTPLGGMSPVFTIQPSTTEATHLSFGITSDGGQLYQADGVTAIKPNDLIEVARGVQYRFKLAESLGGSSNGGFTVSNARITNNTVELLGRTITGIVMVAASGDGGYSGGGDSGHGDGSGEGARRGAPADTGWMVAEGRGGGGKGGGEGGGTGAVEDPNTLQSKSTARVLDILGEGEIVGLVDGGKSIFLNDTPLIAQDGSENFKGVTWAQRFGLPVQPHIDGFAAAETAIGVGIEVTADAPVTRTITDPDADAARIIIRLPALTEQDPKTGDLHGSRVDIVIAVRAQGGGWSDKVTDGIVGKTTSPYERAYYVPLPAGGAPWDIRVTRRTADSDKATVQNQTYFQTCIVLTEGKFIHPDTATIALTVDAERFGSQIPARAYDVKGLKVPVPANYDPVKRTYSGFWDGTFKEEWSDNPVWCLVDLLTQRRYGLGKYLDLSQINLGTLYTIARYCDQPVPAGYKDPQGNPVTEPRYSFNAVINTREDAYKVIQAFASTVRGLVYWSSGQIYLRADMPRDVKKIVAPANVIDGTFTYSGTALKARHSVVKVQWNDPNDTYKAAIERVEDPALIRKYGYNETSFTAYGCTSRSQARRMGRWLLYTEDRETESVTYECAFDQADVSPGDLIAIVDPSYVGGDANDVSSGRYGGRVMGATASVVTLDAPVQLNPGRRYTLTVVIDGALVERDVVNVDGLYPTLTVNPPFDAPPLANAMWALTGSDVAPRPFNVEAVRERSPGRFEVTGLFHDATKFAAIEDGLFIDPPSFQLVGSALPAPENLTAQETTYWVNGLPQSRITVSWTPSPLPEVMGYIARVLTPGGQWQDWQVQSRMGFDIEPAAEGRYLIRVQAASRDGRQSAPAELSIAARGKGTPPGKPTGLRAVGGIRQITLDWSNPGDSDLDHVEVHVSETEDIAAATYVGEAKGTHFVHAGLGGLEHRWYWVRAVDIAGNVGDFNANLGTDAETELVSVNDVGRELYEMFYADLPKRIPAIDFSFLDEQVENVIGDGPLGHALLETVRQGYDRFEEIRTERGVSDARFAAVDTQITELVTDTEATASQLTVVGSEFNANKALVLDRLTTLANADSAMAERVQLVDARVAGNSASILTETRARVDAVQSVATQSQLLRTDFENNKAGVASEIKVVSDAASATARTVNTLVSRVGDNEGAIASEARTRADQDGALSWRIDQQRSYTDGAIAGYDSQIKTWVNNSSSVASSIQTLQSTVGQHNTSIQQYASVVDGLKGRWGVSIDNNGHVVGIALVNDGVYRNAFIVSADNFLVSKPGFNSEVPFAVSNVYGQPRVTITRAMIGDALIDNAAIQVAAIDRANIRDLTVNGQKIEDFSCSNMNASSGVFEARVGLVTTGKRVLITATRGWKIDTVVGYGGGENASERYERTWSSVSVSVIETPGAGYHEWVTANSDIYGRNPSDFFCTISVVELRK